MLPSDLFAMVLSRNGGRPAIYRNLFAAENESLANISRNENTFWYKKIKINTWNDTAVDNK